MLIYMEITFLVTVKVNICDNLEMFVQTCDKRLASHVRLHVAQAGATHHPVDH